MAESKIDKIKFKILKALDVSGFTVFDPLVRLAFREEPKKQIDALAKYMLAPSLFMLLCVSIWWWAGPRHKTKSGEVPTPDIVWDSVEINSEIARREKIKEKDFLLSGTKREQVLAEVKKAYGEKRSAAEALKAEVGVLEKELAAKQASQISPLQANYDLKKSEYSAVQKARKMGIEQLAEQVAIDGASEISLLKAIRDDKLAIESERDELKALKVKIDEVRSEKFQPLVDARKAYDKQADELLFIKTRLQYLEARNLSLKVAETESNLAEYVDELDAAESGKEALSLAKKAVRSEESLDRLEGQEYASAVTIYQQIKRSIFTVFCGFFMAAFVAIPIGIMCGLNRIFMACMTPIISIFRPVSPVVWLLIFQIVVGAFFPDPESHPLFLFLDSLPFISSLDVNPALVFSACTVAMCAVWPALVNTALGVSSIDQDHINVARVLRLGFWNRLFKIVIPSSLPLMFAGLRISLGVGWMVLIAAEALSSSDGLGKFVWDEYQNGSSLTFANIIMVCFVVGIIGFFLDRMMILFQRLVSFDEGGATV